MGFEQLRLHFLCSHDILCETSAEPFEQFGMHLMRLTGSEAQNDKSFKFGDDHDFYSIVQHDDRVVLFGSRQIGDVKRGYIYQMCHNDPGTKESGNSFSQIGNGIINTIDLN